MEDREYNLAIAEESSSVITNSNKVTESLPFFSYCAGHYLSGKDYFTVNRVLEGYLLIYTVAGKGLLEIGEQQYGLEPSSMFLINCDKTPHQYRCDGDTWQLYFVRFGGQGCQGYSNVICGTQPTVVVHMKYPERVVENFRKIIDMSVQYSSIASLEICLALTHLLTDMATSGKTVARPNATIQNLIHVVNVYINQNYQNKITIEDIGQAVHLSPFHLTRVFKKYTGYSLYEYLNIFRINRAAELLCSTGLQVQEIGDRVGFQSINAFMRLFKKHKGISPAKYRQHR